MATTPVRSVRLQSSQLRQDVEHQLLGVGIGSLAEAVGIAFSVDQGADDRRYARHAAADPAHLFGHVADEH